MEASQRDGRHKLRVVNEKMSSDGITDLALHFERNEATDSVKMYWEPPIAAKCAECGSPTNFECYLRAGVPVNLCTRCAKPGDFFVFVNDSVTSAGPVAQVQIETTHTRVVKLISAGASLANAARQVGIAKSTAFEHLRRHKAKECSCETSASSSVS